MGAGVRTKLPQACLDAACSFSEKMGRPCKRIGLSLGIAPTHGPVNHSTYRRIDARFGAPLSQSIEAALAAPEDPWEIRHSTKMLKLFSHVAPRLSDTVILTNLGRQHMPGITRLEGFPVARGRSAVAYGAIRLAGGDSTITLRARDIDLDDANAIIDDVIARIAFNL